MYRATVDKKIKTETRRTHGLSGINLTPSQWEIKFCRFNDDNRLVVYFYNKKHDYSTFITSKYKKGEILYIAEPMWVQKEYSLNLTPLEIPHLYHYDCDETTIASLAKKGDMKKLSPMFMKQQYGRHFIIITDIFCERLQDITRRGIISEGIEENHTNTSDYLLRVMFSTLFDKINGAGSWNKNEYVFGYRFDYLPNYKRRLNA